MNPILLFKKMCSSKWSVLALAFIFSANLSMAQIENDDCGDAIMLSCGESVTGNNDEASTEMLPSCGLVFPGQTVWYTIMGTGGEITATTCNGTTNFDSQIGVFSGSCGDLTCVAGNNNDVGCGNRRLSTVSFDSEAGELYYIVVAGVSGAGGDYELSVSCEEVAPPNDLCADAEPINCGDTVDGSTATATNSGAPGFCGTSLSSAPGVWYELAGDGSLVTASLCGSSFDTKIGVFSGSCGDLDCVTGNDDECGLQSEVEFNTTAGVSYYIYVTGFSSSSGDFTLSVSCASPVANDECVNALPLDCNSSVTGSTVGAGAESVSFCGTSLTSSGGVWYEIIGTGFDITVSTCNPGTDFDTKLGVFTGSCGDLECVGGNDDGTPVEGTPDDACVVEGVSTFNRASNVTITESVEGQSYFVLVTGFSSNTGTFELSAICEDAPPPPANGTCDEAVAISCDGGSVVGNTNEGSISDIACGNSGDQQLGTSPGLWYTITGAGNLVSLSTCNDVLDFDVRISVFAGSCDGLSCVAFANNGAPGDCPFFFNRAASLEFPALEGVTYYIYVNGVQGATGNFQLDIDCRPINDDCSGALAIECGGTASGSTVDANPDDFPSCGTSNFGARGVWYTITGNGNVLTAETCGSSYDTKLFVFEGSCEGLACLGGNDDACGLQSRVQWSSTDGVTYYILVSGFSSSSAGNYTLSIPGDCSIDPGDCSADGIIDDVCDADCLEIDVETAFSNAGATAQAGEVSPGAGTGASSCNSTDGWCSFETDVDNSVWFKFIAPEGGCVNVSATDADLQLAIWQATDCSNFGTFTEVAANDDSGPGNAPFLEFVSVNPGEVYWVQIDGFNGATETAGTVLVSACPDATGIAACEAATTILCGETISGSTSGIAPLTDLPTCGTTLNTAGGAWFRFDGIGDNVTVTTCNDGTNYDTKLGVFTGACTDQGLICVGGNDDGSPSGANPDAACVVSETGSTFNRASTLTFAAMTGQTYYIYVTGFLTNAGSFELSVDCGTTLVDNPSGLQANDNIHLNNSKYAGAEVVAVGEFYPNPAEYGSTNIEIYAPVEGEVKIQLFDNIGRLANVTEVDLYSGVNTVALQLGNLPAGSYFANIVIGDVVERKKLIIAK